MNNIKYFFIPLISLFALLSCGKAVDDKFNVDDPQIYDKVYSAQAVDNSASQTYSFPMTEQGQIKVFANFGGLSYPESNITVKFRVAPEYLAIYNYENYSSLEILAAESYSISNTEVTIPAGKLRSTDAVIIDIDTNYLEGTGVYVLPVHIESVNGVSIPPISKDLRTVYLKVNGYFDTNPYQYIDRATWGVSSYSSQEPNEDSGRGGSAFNAIDDDNYTYWSTAWRASQPGHPHWIAIDMGEDQDLHGFTIRGRADNDDIDKVYARSNPIAISIQIGNDGVVWTDAGSYTLEHQLENTFYLDRFVASRYFKVIVTSSYGDTHFTSIAEINAF